MFDSPFNRVESSGIKIPNRALNKRNMQSFHLVEYKRSRAEVEKAYTRNMQWIHNKKIHKNKIKNRCFICCFWFKNSWEHYSVYGNSCTVCSARAVSVLYPSKQKPKNPRKPLSREEAQILLAERVKWVKENNFDKPHHRLTGKRAWKNNILVQVHE